MEHRWLIYNACSQEWYVINFANGFWYENMACVLSIYVWVGHTVCQSVVVLIK